jgi:NAD(P)H-hydrate epimerase
MCIHPKQVFTREEIRDFDSRAIKEFAMPGLLLMENAGLSVARFLLSQGYLGKVVICCGPGNNGGDGLVLARHLFNHDVDVEVIISPEPVKWSDGAQTNFNIVKKLHIPIYEMGKDEAKSHLAHADWIIDALFGIGLNANIKAPFIELIEEINHAKAKVLAIDIPSGLDANTGEVLGDAVKADVTLTCVGLKKGFLNPEAEQYLGDIRVIDIGLPKILLHPYQLMN